MVFLDSSTGSEIAEAEVREKSTSASGTLQRCCIIAARMCIVEERILHSDQTSKQGGRRRIAFERRMSLGRVAARCFLCR